MKHRGQRESEGVLPELNASHCQRTRDMYRLSVVMYIGSVSHRNVSLLSVCPQRRKRTRYQKEAFLETELRDGGQGQAFEYQH